MAQAAIGNERAYNIIMDNCHQFTAECILGEFDNPNNFLFFLKHTVETEMNDGNSIQWLALDWRK